MTDLEKALAAALQASTNSSKKHGARISALREQIRKKCTHPQEQQQDYEWEHDSGYGRQTMVTGVYCKLCLAEKRWKGATDLWTRDGEYV